MFCGRTDRNVLRQDGQKYLGQDRQNYLRQDRHKTGDGHDSSCPSPVFLPLGLFEETSVSVSKNRGIYKLFTRNLEQNIIVYIWMF